MDSFGKLAIEAENIIIDGTLNGGDTGYGGGGGAGQHMGSSYGAGGAGGGGGISSAYIENLTPSFESLRPGLGGDGEGSPASGCGQGGGSGGGVLALYATDSIEIGTTGFVNMTSKYYGDLEGDWDSDGKQEGGRGYGVSSSPGGTGSSPTFHPDWGEAYSHFDGGLGWGAADSVTTSSGGLGGQGGSVILYCQNLLTIAGNISISGLGSSERAIPGTLKIFAPNQSITGQIMPSTGGFRVNGVAGFAWYSGTAYNKPPLLHEKNNFTDWIFEDTGAHVPMYSFIKISKGRSTLSPVTDMYYVKARKIEIDRLERSTYGIPTANLKYYVRGSNAEFSQQDSVLPWEPYILNISREWRYIQIKIEHSV